MPIDPYAVLRALLRAEARRNAPGRRNETAQEQRPPKEKRR
ncbi:hypothetical protein [Streptomyces griseoluteus]|nr:hypothetical protein [Streptomyces griseoluteus]GHF03699.1 hypothetical protein GCM10017776_21540 [Streptomyces griseoluteus]